MADQKKSAEKDSRQKLKWETARELGLDDDLKNPGENLTAREAGKIGGNMVRKLVKRGEQSLAKDNSLRQEPEL